MVQARETSPQNPELICKSRTVVWSKTSTNADVGPLPLPNTPPLPAEVAPSCAVRLFRRRTWAQLLTLLISNQLSSPVTPEPGLETGSLGCWGGDCCISAFKFDCIACSI